MNVAHVARDIVLEPVDNGRLANLCGQFDEHLRQIERRLDIEIASRGNYFRVIGNPGAAKIGTDVIFSLFNITDKERLDPQRVHVCLEESIMNQSGPLKLGGVSSIKNEEEFSIQTPKKLVRARGSNQRSYLENIQNSDLTFGIGLAGTGKTYLAVASAIDALDKEQVADLFFF